MNCRKPYKGRQVRSDKGGGGVLCLGGCVVQFPWRGTGMWEALAERGKGGRGEGVEVMSRVGLNDWAHLYALCKVAIVQVSRH
jgi:hypothetical protein